MLIEQTFKHKISKGSKFNQVYIPKDKATIFQVGDLVEVKLIEKKQIDFYKNITKGILGDFKINIIKEIFSLITQFKEIGQTLLFGSFLTQNKDYNDIDIALITKTKNIEEKIYAILSEKLPFKFHIISLDKERLKKLLEFCPLTRSMFYYSISDKELEIPKKTKINKDHLEFLLMMPEDLLKVNLLNSRAYFDSLRRLLTIKHFLKNEKIEPQNITSEMKAKLEGLYNWAKNNEILTKENYDSFKKIIMEELKEVRKLLWSIKN